jgi:hypothetical protein
MSHLGNFVPDETNLGFLMAAARQKKERVRNEHGETKVIEAGAVRSSLSAYSPDEPRFGQVRRELWRRGADRRRPVALQPRRSEGARPIVHIQLGACHRSEPDAGRFRLVSAGAGRVELSGL